LGGAAGKGGSFYFLNKRKMGEKQRKGEIWTGVRSRGGSHVAVYVNAFLKGGKLKNGSSEEKKANLQYRDETKKP